MTYNFKCPKCRKNVEIRESMVNIDKLKPMCPKCEVGMIRVYVAPIVKYYGNGWTKQVKEQK